MPIITQLGFTVAAIAFGLCPVVYTVEQIIGEKIVVVPDNVWEIWEI